MRQASPGSMVFGSAYMDMSSSLNLIPLQTFKTLLSQPYRTFRTQRVHCANHEAWV